MASLATHFFCHRLAAHDHAVAVVDRDGAAISYRDLDGRANDFVAQLGPERRLVFLETPNTVDALAAYLACLKGQHPVYLFSCEDQAAVQPLIGRYRPNAVVTSGPGAVRIDWQNREVLNLHPDLAVLLSTSGSTGSPKFVKLSHRNLDSNALAIANYLGLTSSDRAATSLKFNYSYGLSVVNSHFACGAALVLTDDSITSPRFWERFRATGATSFAGVPYMFEAFRQSGMSLEGLPALRHVTQAGGRLAPELISHYARLAREQGWRFYVMYGQTEASPRMAYLPPELVEQYPHCIGVPIPGGRIDLLDDDGRPVDEADVPGQLVYSGPNVMMGYAERTEDLALDETPAQLHTGDIASRTRDGLFYIVGRTTRFVKLFGLRVNLDDLETQLQVSLPGARCAGDDQRIVIAVLEEQRHAAVIAMGELARATHLPEFVFRITVLSSIPLLRTGKADYVAILATAEDSSPPLGVEAATSRIKVLFSREFAREYIRAMAEVLGIRNSDWQSAEHIFRTLIGRRTVRPTDTFITLAGDSMSYVQVSLALQQYLGRLPQDWANLTVREIDQEHEASRGRPV